MVQSMGVLWRSLYEKRKGCETDRERRTAMYDLKVNFAGKNERDQRKKAKSEGRSESGEKSMNKYEGANRDTSGKCQKVRGGCKEKAD